MARAQAGKGSQRETGQPFRTRFKQEWRMSVQPADSGEQKCARCGVAFTCGFDSGDNTCWCFAFADLPRERLDAANSCFCAGCLETELQKSAGSSA
jgi:hypothetical protein